MTRVEFLSYAGIKAINFSTLKHIAKSPLHYQHALSNPREDSTPLIKGRAGHTAVLEPDRFPVEYAVFKGKTRKGKAWDAFKELHSDDSILKLDEYNTCLAFRDAVRSHPIASKYLHRPKTEQTIEWVDEDTGLKCKARLDLISEDMRAIVDLKGVKSVDARIMGLTAARMGWHQQLAFYQYGLRMATGRDYSAVILAGEFDPPHDVGVFTLNDDDLAIGWDAVAKMLARVKECTDAGAWPGRYPDAQPIQLPGYLWPEDDQIMSARVLDEEAA